LYSPIHVQLRRHGGAPLRVYHLQCWKSMWMEF
jgi:hypothetical protein